MTLTRERPAPATALAAAVLAFAGSSSELLGHTERAWRSITFSGARHTLRVKFEGEAGIAAGERFVEGLAEAGFEVPGALVADICITCAEWDFIGDRQSLVATAEILLLHEGY